MQWTVNSTVIVKCECSFDEAQECVMLERCLLFLAYSAGPVLVRFGIKAAKYVSTL